MNLIVWLCAIGVLLGSIVAEENFQEEEGLDTDHEIAAKSLERATKVLDVYDKTMDHVIKWEVFHETMDALEKGRGRYTQTSGELVDHIATSMLNSEKHYFSATQSIYSWCGESMPLLERYMELFKDFDKQKADVQKELLLEVLNSGIKKMNVALDHINQTIANFDIASGKLSTLDNQLELDFKDGSKKSQEAIERIKQMDGWMSLVFPFTIRNFFPVLEKIVEDSRHFFKGLRNHVNIAIEETKIARDELKRETIIIADLHSKMKVKRTFVGIKVGVKALIVKLSYNLIKQCRTYRRRHGKV